MKRKDLENPIQNLLLVNNILKIVFLGLIIFSKNAISNEVDPLEEAIRPRDNLKFPTFSPLNSLNNENCVGSQLEIEYCNRNIKLYKIKVNFNVKDHSLRWDYVDSVIRYSFVSKYILEYHSVDDITYIKYKIRFDF